MRSPRWDSCRFSYSKAQASAWFSVFRINPNPLPWPAWFDLCKLLLPDFPAKNSKLSQTLPCLRAFALTVLCLNCFSPPPSTCLVNPWDLSLSVTFSERFSRILSKISQVLSSTLNSSPLPYPVSVVSNPFLGSLPSCKLMRAGIVPVLILSTYPEECLAPWTRISIWEWK